MAGLGGWLAWVVLVGWLVGWWLVQLCCGVKTGNGSSGVGGSERVGRERKKERKERKKETSGVDMMSKLPIPRDWAAVDVAIEEVDGAARGDGHGRVVRHGT